MRQHPVPRALLAATVVAFTVAGISYVLGWQGGFIWAIAAGVPLALLWLIAEVATWRWSRRHPLDDDTPRVTGQ